MFSLAKQEIVGNNFDLLLKLGFLSLHLNTKISKQIPWLETNLSFSNHSYIG